MGLRNLRFAGVCGSAVLLLGMGTAQARGRQRAVAPASPVCVTFSGDACPEVVRPQDSLYLSLKLSGPAGVQRRALIEWGDGQREQSGWDDTDEFSLRLNHRYPGAGRYTVRIWQERAGGQRSRPLSVSVQVAPAPAGPEVQALPHVRNSLGMEFVLLPAGSFERGSPQDEEGRFDDETQHSVTLTQAFYLQTTEVTQAQWQAVMGDNPSGFNGDNLPVENVSWEDVQAFIKKLNARGEGTFRLPTEAEWEYAARAGTKTPFGIGKGVDLDSRQANFDGLYPYGAGRPGIARDTTMPVKSFAPNAWGLYDMHGNVWEWVQDRYGDYPRGTVTDPQGPSTGVDRVTRSGSWLNSAQGARSAYRNHSSPDARNGDLGFRLFRGQ